MNPDSTKPVVVRDPYSSGPQYKLHDLVDGIDRLMREPSSSLTGQERFTALVDQLQIYFDHNGESNCVKDLAPYLFYDPAVPYTRNIIQEGPGYALLALCWGVEKESPVHDHPGCECLVAVVAGQLLESVYEWPVDTDTPKTQLRSIPSLGGLLQRSGVSHMSDTKGLHKLAQFGPSAGIRCRNADTNQPTECAAISLHLYLPPYSQCRLFTSGTASSIVGKVQYYTNGGKRCQNTLSQPNQTQPPRFDK